MGPTRGARPHGAMHSLRPFPEEARTLSFRLALKRFSCVTVAVRGTEGRVAASCFIQGCARICAEVSRWDGSTRRMRRMRSLAPSLMTLHSAGSNR